MFASAQKEGDGREVRKAEQFLVKTTGESATLHERAASGII